MSLILTSKREREDAGHFRIGTVVLTVPPEEISISKVQNNEERMPMRARHAKFIKTGHARTDVSIRWKALVQYHEGQGAPDYSEWKQVQEILAMFQAAPFVEVENSHLRQILIQQDPSYVFSDRMGFALRQFRVDTLPDIVDGLQCSLTMSWFNYRPYTRDFAYLDSKGAKCDAYLSDRFQAYLKSWIDTNLDNPQQVKRDYPYLAPWESQTPGGLTFNWRRYIALPKGPAASQDPQPTQNITRQNPAVAYKTPVPSRARSSSMQPAKPPEHIREIITRIAQEKGVDANLCLAVCQRESSFNPKNKNPTSTASGLFQLVKGTAARFGCNDVFDAESNARAGITYIAYLLKMFNGNFEQALTGFTGGEGSVKTLGVSGTWAKYNWIPGWLADVTSILSRLNSVHAAAPAAPPPPSAFTDVKKQNEPAGASSDDDLVNLLTSSEYNFRPDYNTDRASFLFRAESLTLSDEEHSGTGVGLSPTQISVVFVNNIVQQPLNSFQYPTAQHIGPAGTMISISMMSEGDIVDDGGEPQHESLGTLSAAVSILEDQYHRMKGEWKSVKSIHGMQAMVLENQVLNLLGIYGVMPQSMDTSTIAESPNLVQASLTCNQYENVFEQVHPFIVKGTAEYDKIWKERVFAPALSSGAKNFLDSQPSDDPILQPLRDFVYQRRMEQLNPLYKWMTANSLTPDVAMNIPLSDEDTRRLKDACLPALKNTNQKLAASVESHSQLNFTDFVLLSQTPDAVAGKSGKTPGDVTSKISDITAATHAQVGKGSVNPTHQLYDIYLEWLMKNDRRVASAVQRLEMTDGLHKELMAAVDPDGPGSSSFMLEHGAYRDLGLSRVDSSPGEYFFDYADSFRREMSSYLSLASERTAQTTDYFNNIKATTHLDLQSSDPAVFNGKVSKSAADVLTIDTGGAPAPVAGGGALQASANAREDQKTRAGVILGRTIIPFNSMSRAFPAFKLMFAEEDNSGTFYMFDDFYSYSSILNAEIIRYQDKPDQAVIQLTNLANLLSQKILDNSLEGKYEYDGTNLQATPTSSDGSAVQTPIQTKQFQSETVGGVNYTGRDMSDGYDKTGQKIPLQYLSLQTGTKIQFRVGFSNNPDLLFPVFSGVITQIDEGETTTIVAQGFGVELTESQPDDLEYNGYNLAFLGNFFTKLITGSGDILKGAASLIASPSGGVRDISNGAGLIVRGLGKGPAFGGSALMGDAGNASSVMAAMLKTSKAVHFGHWQVGVPATPIMRGFGYARRLGDALSGLGMDRAASMLRSGYDRSGENIYTSSIMNFDGKVQKGVRRDFSMEAPLNIFAASYYVPKEPSITPWRIIQDVKRRYPEYIVKVAPYGFPFGVDATLVFAPPNDVYVSRLPLFGEGEKARTSPEDQASFREWWNKNSTKLRGIKTGTSIPWCSETLQRVTGAAGVSEDDAISKLADLISDEKRGREIFTKVMNAGVETAGRYEAFAKIPIETTKGTLGNIADTVGGFVQGNFLFRLEYAAQAINLAQQFRRLQQQMEFSLQMLSRGIDGAPRPNDRIQPVRKWHLVTFHNIIHNGIQVNDQIYNSVRIQDETIACNDGVQTFQAHMHVLDVDRLIIDPVNNVRQPKLQNPYAQSFLKEELGKMYRGELVLTGIPEIEPHDVILLYDPSNGMMGPIEVESVIHSLDQESGYMSIVKPRALVMVNEAFTAGLGSALATFWDSAIGEGKGLLDDFLNLSGNQKTEIVGAAAVAGIGAKIGSRIALGGVTSLAGGVTGAVAGAEAAASATAAVEAVAAVTVSGPVLLTVGAVAALGGFMVMATKLQGLNPMFIAPLSRFGRPWVAGVDGWQLSDLHTSINRQWQTFQTYEIQPTLRGFKDFLGISQDLGAGSK